MAYKKMQKLKRNSSKNPTTMSQRWKLFIFTGLFAVIGALLLLNTYAATNIQTAEWFGVAGVASPGTPSAASNRVVPIGSRAMRLEVRWDRTEPSRGNYNFSDYNAVLDDARNKNVKVLALLAYAPSWARDSQCNSNGYNIGMCEPNNPSDFGNWAREAAKYLKTKGVNEFEIWNEPNISHFWKDKIGKPSPSKYAAIVKDAYPKIKSVHSNSTVIIGSTANGSDYVPGSSSNENSIDPRLFLQNLYANGIKGNFDAISHHPYTWAAGNTNHDLDTQRGWYLMHTDEPGKPSLRSILASNGEGSKKIWNTEWGLPSTTQIKADGSRLRHTEDTQATALNQAINKWKSYIEADWAGKFYAFRYIDTKSYGDNHEAPIGQHADYMGLTKTQGSPGCTAQYAPTGSSKKSYCTYKKFIMQNSTISTGASTPPPPPSQDTTIDLAVITFPKNGDSLSGTITMSVSASDQSGVDRVVLYVDGDSGIVDQSAPYTRIVDTTKLANKETNFGAHVYDKKGNKTFVRNLAVVNNSPTAVNNPSPETTNSNPHTPEPKNQTQDPAKKEPIMITLPGSNALQEVAPGQIPRVVGETKLKNPISSPSIKTTVVVDGREVQTVEGDEVTLDTSTFTNGDHEITLKSVDESGNVTETSRIVKVDNDLSIYENIRNNTLMPFAGRVSGASMNAIFGGLSATVFSVISVVAISQKVRLLSIFS